MRWLMLIGLCVSSAHADTTAPSPAAADPTVPLISGDAIAISSFFGRNILRDGLALLGIAPPFEVVELVDAARARAVIAAHHLKPFPLKVLSETFAWGHQRMFDLKADSGGLRFRVRSGWLTIVRAGRVLVRRPLSTPGKACYELTPYVADIWLDPARDIVAIRTWGDKCEEPRVDWELISLLSPGQTLQHNLLHDP
jgi:hypothetical protein